MLEIPLQSPLLPAGAGQNFILFEEQVEVADRAQGGVGIKGVGKRQPFEDNGTNIFLLENLHHLQQNAGVDLVVEPMPQI